MGRLAIIQVVAIKKNPPVCYVHKHNKSSASYNRPSPLPTKKCLSKEELAEAAAAENEVPKLAAQRQTFS
jgi:hypothetical protein